MAVTTNVEAVNRSEAVWIMAMRAEMLIPPEPDLACSFEDFD